MFFLYSLSSPHPLSLASLKALISDVFITRNDVRIEELAAERRAGRPKIKEQLEMEEMKRREQAEYETGFGAFVPPLYLFLSSHLPLSYLDRSLDLLISYSLLSMVDKGDDLAAAPFPDDGTIADTLMQRSPT